MARPQSIQAVLPGLLRILRAFAPQIQQQKSLLIISSIALVLEVVTRLLEPWPLKYIFDGIILPTFGGQPVDTLPLLEGIDPMLLLTLLTLSIVVISGLRGMAAYSGTVGMSLAATHIMADVRGRLYTHLQNLSLSFHHKAKHGDLITRVTYDIERLREVTVTAALPLAVNVLTLVGMVGLMFWLNWELAVLAIAVLPLFLLSTVRLTRKIQGVARLQRKREGAMAATAAESIGAIKVVQALSLQSMLESAFSSHNRKSLKEGAQSQRLVAQMERTVEVLVAIATAIVLWRGVQLVQQQVVSAGDLLVFVNYLKTAFKPMRQLAKYTGQIAKATASGERIIDILDIVPDIQDTRGAEEAPPFRGEVQFLHVNFAYETDKGILRDLSFSIQPGQRVALVGPSGGGKSTLVSLLLRLYDPTEGGVLIDGADIRQYKLHSLRQQISVVLQDSVLFAVSVRDNIAYGSLGVSDEAIVQSAKLANAHDFIMGLPQGYSTILGERGATLSGGQRQRIAIARAAVRQAPIVILDEPTVGLDNESEHLVREALDRLTQGRTSFLISHDLRAVENADQILYIEKGKVREQGTHAELIQLGDRYARLYRLQSGQSQQNDSDQSGKEKPYALQV